MVSSLLEKSATLRELGELTAAAAAIGDAKAIAAEKFDRSDRRHALVALEHGRFNLAAGNLSVAEGDLMSAVESLREQEEPARLAEALCALAELRGVTGGGNEARRLLDEAETLRRKIMPLSHRALAAVQRQLSDLTARERLPR